MHSLVITTLLVLVIAATGGLAIKCYVCNGVGDGNCGNKGTGLPNPSDCSGVCAKTTTTLANTVTSARFCDLSNNRAIGCTDNVGTRYCYCNSDKCNAAGHNHIAMASVMLTAIGAVLCQL